MTTAEKVKAIRKALKLTQAAFAERLKIGSSYISDIEKGNKHPSAPLISLLKLRFKVSPEWWESPGKGEMFKKGLNTLLDSSAPRQIPVLGRISAGFPNLAIEEVLEFISVPGPPDNSFALVVKGSSMEPTFRDGDYVIFIPDEEYKPDDVLIVLDEWGDAMVKRLKEKAGKNFLVSDNSAYPTIEPNEYYRIVGKVVKVLRDIKF